MRITGADLDALARALHRAHWAALDSLHGPDPGSETAYDLEQPERRAYLKEQARALLIAGWRDRAHSDESNDPNHETDEG